MPSYNLVCALVCCYKAFTIKHFKLWLDIHFCVKCVTNNFNYVYLYPNICGLFFAFSLCSIRHVM